MCKAISPPVSNCYLAAHAVEDLSRANKGASVLATCTFLFFFSLQARIIWGLGRASKRCVSAYVKACGLLLYDYFSSSIFLYFPPEPKNKGIEHKGVATLQRIILQTV